MNHRTPPPLTLRTRAVVALLALLGSTGACADAAYYHDGTTQRTITLDFALGSCIITPAASAAAPQGAHNPDHHPSGNAAARQPATRPRLEQPGHPGLPRRRLPRRPADGIPGGVLVKLNPEWTDTQARAWAASKGLPISQRLNITGNWYLLASTPGNAALELANQLHASGEVLSATPNWWKKTKPR